MPDISRERIRYGYTLTDLDRLARLCVTVAWARMTDHRDRYDAAWHAIAETLYTATEPPTERDLTTAGVNAISRLAQDEQRHHGQHVDAGLEGRPNFQRYWALARVTPSPEDGIVDRIALAQIWPTLSATHRQALIALAVYEDHDLASSAIDRSPATYRQHLKNGRAAFRVLWHEGEVPSRMWGRSMGSKVGRRTATQVLVRRRQKRASVAQKAAAA